MWFHDYNVLSSFSGDVFTMLLVKSERRKRLGLLSGYTGIRTAPVVRQKEIATILNHMKFEVHQHCSRNMQQLELLLLREKHALSH